MLDKLVTLCILLSLILAEEKVVGRLNLDWFTILLPIIIPFTAIVLLAACIAYVKIRKS